MGRWLAKVAPGGIVLVLLLWGIEEAVDAGLVKRSLMPAPTDIGRILWELFVDGQVAGPLAETLARLGIGFAIGATLAVIMGLAMGYWPRVYGLFEPLIELLRPIPKAALVPPLVLFLGVGDAMKITSIALAVFFPVLINTVQGARGVDPVLIDTARISEMIAGTGGVGFLIIDMQRAFRVRQMYAWIVILAVVGYLLNLLILAAERRFLFWYQATERT